MINPHQLNHHILIVPKGTSSFPSISTLLPWLQPHSANKKIALAFSALHFFIHYFEPLSADEMSSCIYRSGEAVQSSAGALLQGKIGLTAEVTGHFSPPLPLERICPRGVRVSRTAAHCTESPLGSFNNPHSWF